MTQKTGSGSGKLPTSKTTYIFLCKEVYFPRQQVLRIRSHYSRSGSAYPVLNKPDPDRVTKTDRIRISNTCLKGLLMIFMGSRMSFGQCCGASRSRSRPKPPFLAVAGAETITLFRIRLRKVSYKSIFINSIFF